MHNSLGNALQMTSYC